ncbi:sugar (pentulose or hexulose) kinase [Ruminiclostridium sufflavum DSM 19573]|uniref:Sugar (Pentulose or hexulose) kinase n=1 Tax=Ruminiclostridium sufflavum DSM 19573 TaxID=1121337 RepID=A0A318XS75_9FIRM|nr:FGGY-family carbohydrate kinase [Ruminiclostridium sufflavum]PYG89424.1 sugar (pentulose or hexulose) kinase [Ruminiclostridium sufflavum DSM 19573]
MSCETNYIRNIIINGQTVIGIELGSSRIKTVLIGADNTLIASGNYEWENRYINSIWTYSIEDIWKGVQDSYQKMTRSVKDKFGVAVKTTGTIGISAMMHGYMAFGKNNRLLTPFRTWRNNITGQASESLTKLFNYPVPQRWSIAHLYQAILNQEEHVSEIAYMTTLSGYIHWQLTGQKVLGIGDASGMFPIDLKTCDFNSRMIMQFNEAINSDKLQLNLKNILPTVMVAGEKAGELTAEGAKLLDITGQLQAGIPLCPPEGDAGTGMVATNSVSVRTGNVSAGTSVFAMIVLEKELSRTYSEIDLVTTPEGKLVAMVHSNNCTSDYDAWMGLFSEAIKALGMDIGKPKLYDTLLGLALKGASDCGGLLAYGYISGEHITHFEEGCPLFVRTSKSSFNLANFMRVNLFTALGALKTGLNILFEEEAVRVDKILGHGGFFKTKEVGQKIMSAAINAPVSIMETAGEGGAWGIALLGSYMLNRKNDESLGSFLNEKVFAGEQGRSVNPDPADVAGFNEFMKRYTAGLAVERAAVDYLK